MEEKRKIDKADLIRYFKEKFEIAIISYFIFPSFLEDVCIENVKYLEDIVYYLEHSELKDE